MIKKPSIFESKGKVPKGAFFADVFPQAIKELFFLEHPRFKNGDRAADRELKAFVKNAKFKAVWAYYPWRHLAIRIPEENIYFRLRTARNRNLITEEEQKNYRRFAVGIAGLSVGSCALSSLVMCGGPKTLRIADPDTVDITNLNRIRAKLFDIGKNKVEIAAREAWELDPFLNIALFKEGVKESNIREFISGKTKLDVFIDEMDDINLKIKSRFVCRDSGIPVVMATDNGDGVVVDVERFDIDPKRPVFHGKIPARELNKKIESFEKIRMAAKIIDPAYFTERQQDSILNVGKTLSGVAQIGTAAAMAGAAVAYAVRQIANKIELPSGRYVIKPEEIFSKGYNSAARKKRRAAMTGKFRRSFGL